MWAYVKKMKQNKKIIYISIEIAECIVLFSLTRYLGTYSLYENVMLRIHFDSQLNTIFEKKKTYLCI